MTLTDRFAGVCFIVAIGMSVIAYNFYKDAKNERALKEAYAAEVVQNDSAYKSTLNQVLSDKQTLAVRVENLNADVSKKDAEKGYWKVLATTYKIQLDSAHHQGSGVASSGVDSTGEYGQVDFSGSRGIAAFSGYTRYYLKSEASKPFWYLDLAYHEFPMKSLLYQDTDGIWKIKTSVDEPGVKFTAQHSVDSTIFISYKSQLPKPVEKIIPFGIRLKANLAVGNGVSESVSNISSMKTSNIGLDASAEVYYNYWNVTYYPLVKVLSAGVVFEFEIGNFLRSIF
jgi:hypothetical protein